MRRVVSFTNFIYFRFMGFLFPLFLLAAASLLIPLLLHLFNLRKYKRVFFPDTRFLRSLQLSSRKQSKVRNWWLMLMRMLFLAALVTAFAQPYFTSIQEDNQPVVHALFIDNSYSMTAASGQLSLLDKCKTMAVDLVEQAKPDARFVVLTHDRSAATRPMTATETLSAIQEIKPVAPTIPLSSLMNKLHAVKETEGNTRWELYIFSDLQRPAFVDTFRTGLLTKDDAIFIYPARQKGLSNRSVDSCYFLNPALDSRQPNKLLVQLRQAGVTDGSTRLQVKVGNQVRAVKTINFKDNTVLTDTIDLQLSDAGWQQISVSIEDFPLSYDDTFRMTARVQPQLSVLIVGANAIQPYLQAAFSVENGFLRQYVPVTDLQPDKWKAFNLIVLQDVNVLDNNLQTALKAALDNGQQVLMFPGTGLQVNHFNQDIKSIAPITLGAADTSKQTVAQLQQQHQLLRDLFDVVPEDVQLPSTRKRYPIYAGLAARQQSIMSYSDGTPFLAQYSIGRGNLFICAAPLDDRYTNFALGYYFMPLLYKMAIQNSMHQVYARHIGDPEPIWMPVSGSDSRRVFHLSGHGLEGIPAQRPSGSGLNLYIGDMVGEAGFYSLHADGHDTTWLGMNVSPDESILDFAKRSDIERQFHPASVSWLPDNFALQKNWSVTGSGFPLWKIAVAIGLLCLLVETWLLLRKPVTTRTTIEQDPA